MKYVLISIILIIIGAGIYLFMQSEVSIFNGDGSDDLTPTEEEEEDQGEEDESESEEEEDRDDEEVKEPSEEVIGSSVEGRDIKAHYYGDGENEVLLVGGIHGGYSWGTSLLAYEIMDHLDSNPEIIPDNLKVTVIPVLNPDGLSKIVDTDGPFTSSDVFGETVSGRFNANEVDLNRNFDCQWEEFAFWKNNEVNAGSEPFSEPEAKALRDYVEDNKPVAVVIYYGAAGGVYSSSCNDHSPEETGDLMDTYAEASGYPAEGTFDAYKISGDAADWMAKIDVPAISVLLEEHDSSDWSKNRRGVEAVLERYSN
ncbi:MAG: M14 family metallopeptidase [Patescibacteria group bacterium]